MRAKILPLAIILIKAHRPLMTKGCIVALVLPLRYF